MEYSHGDHFTIFSEAIRIAKQADIVVQVDFNKVIVAVDGNTDLNDFLEKHKIVLNDDSLYVFKDDIMYNTKDFKRLDLTSR